MDNDTATLAEIAAILQAPDPGPDGSFATLVETARARMAELKKAQKNLESLGAQLDEAQFELTETRAYGEGLQAAVKIFVDAWARREGAP